MIQQRLLWANFSACFRFSPADQQMAGALAALIKVALFLIAGMQVSDFPLRLTQFKDWTPRRSEVLILFPWFVLFEASALFVLWSGTYLCSRTQGRQELNPWDTEVEKASNICLSVHPSMHTPRKQDGLTPPVLPFSGSLIQAAGWLWYLKWGHRQVSWDRSGAFHVGPKQ